MNAPPSLPRVEICAPLAGSVVLIAVENGECVTAGALIAVVESMKMEHEVHAAHAGAIVALRSRVGDVVAEGDVLVVLQRSDGPAATVSAVAAPRADNVPLRADLLEEVDRWRSALVGAVSPS